MRSRLVLAVIVALALGAMGLAACGGSGGSSERTATATETAEQVPPDAARAGDAAAGSKLALRKVGEFEHPTYVAGAPGYPKLLFVVEQPGRVMVTNGGKQVRRPFLDLRSRVSYDGGERGLLSIAFPSDYKESGRFYVYFVNKGGSIEIDEFHRQSPTRAAPKSRRVVITIPHPTNANHNGGQLQFLGEDLYFGTGDGGAAGDPPNNAQNKNVLLGKLLRIDPLPTAGKPYTVPASAGPRSTVTDCATRSGSASTRSRIRGNRGSSSATSARTASRRSTTPRSPPPAAPTSAGTRSRATLRTRKKTPGRPTPAARRSRSSPTPTRAAAAAR
jgi:hypothetical protein